MYYVPVLKVVGMEATEAANRISHADLLPIISGPTTNSKVVDQNPPGAEYIDTLNWVPNQTPITLTTVGPMQVPRVSGKTREVAKKKIVDAGLIPNVLGSGATIDFTEPDADAWVPRQSPVKLYADMGNQ